MVRVSTQGVSDEGFDASWWRQWSGCRSGAAMMKDNIGDSGRDKAY